MKILFFVSIYDARPKFQVYLNHSSFHSIDKDMSFA